MNKTASAHANAVAEQFCRSNSRPVKNATNLSLRAMKAGAGLRTPVSAFYA